ncbi:DUF4870 domain-containing protein [Amnibacterium kyonggiense]
MSGHRRAAAAPPLTPADEQLWSTLAHLGNIVGFVPSLLILLVLGPRSARVRQESREALNFVITATIAWVALLIVGRVLGVLYDALPTGIDLVFGLLGFLVGLAQLGIWLVVVVLAIAAAVRIGNGGSFRYPLALRLVP